MKRMSYLAGLGIAVCAMTLVPAGPGRAVGSPPSPDLVAVSGDGHMYSREYSRLFDGHILVPDERASGTFVVRNNGETSGYLRIVLTAVEIPNQDALDALTISVATAAHPGILLPVADARPCLTLLAGPTIAPGQSLGVTTVLAMVDLTGTRGQRVPIDFRLQIVLSDSADQNADGCPLAGSSPTVPDDDLAKTGLTGVGGAAVAATALIAVGSALALWFDRRRARQKRNGGNHG